MMTLAEIRLKQNPILTSLLLGMGQGTFIAEKLFPRLPQSLRGVTLAKLGDERFRRYNLRRAPGTATKRVDIKYEGQTYTVDQYSVEVPLPRELLQEAEQSARLNVGAHLDVSRLAMTTASDILALDYEQEAARMAIDPTGYASGHVNALSGGAKWSASTGNPVADLASAANIVRKKIGKRPNLLMLSPDALWAVQSNPAVKSALPNSTQTGPATIEQLKVVFNVKDLVVGDAIALDNAGLGQDVWGNNAALLYAPALSGTGDLSLAEPAFGFTNVLEGHPFAETPYYDPALKSWIYGATYERRASIAYSTAGFLFQNPA